MSSEICLHNATVINGYATMKNCAVLIKDYKIIDVFNETRFHQKHFKDSVTFIDINGAYIAPGFIDTHIHGICRRTLFSKCLKNWWPTASRLLFPRSIPPQKAN